MSRFLGVAVLIALGISGGASPVLGQDDKDDVLGIRWEYELTKPNGDVQKGKFRVYQKEIYIGAKKVGRVDAESPTETTLEFTDSERLGGQAKLTKTGRRPPIWVGRLVKDDGTKWKMRTWLVDR